MDCSINIFEGNQQDFNICVILIRVLNDQNEDLKYLND